ncbi:hypothetical protein F511_10851 [Dorcoceras hygrometricum]|uniref:Uncharacterized protein n=1 Tax=Dorcoceras hygrometricum TaxID=472368 RepID=A0A2Z7AMK6_9LAMI|nr:hypothetical protein F511_10851 [Dorcoceras hygrometricum]
MCASTWGSYVLVNGIVWTGPVREFGVDRDVFRFDQIWMFASGSTSGSYQQMRREVKELKRRRAEESADGLARHGIQSQESRCSGELQSRRKIPVAVFEDSAEAQSSSRLESAAKQLTIYESWMSTAELNSNGENDKKPDKRKGHKYYSPSVLYRTSFEREEFFVQRDYLNRGLYTSRSAIEEVRLSVGDNQSAVAEVDRTMHQQRENESEVLGTKKTISSSYICPADGLQYYRSAVGLVFMESAAGLAMETSKVESAVPASAKERSESAGTGFEKSAGEIKRRRRFQLQVTIDESVSSRNYNRKLCVSSRHGIQLQESRCSGELQSRRKIPVAVFEDSAEAQISSRLESAAKQLTIYESWMSTTELNSNGENDKKPAKEKDTSTIPCRSARAGISSDDVSISVEEAYHDVIISVEEAYHDVIISVEEAYHDVIISVEEAYHDVIISVEEAYHDVIISVEEAYHDVIISVEEAYHDVIISVEEAYHDVIISVEEACGSNRDVIISIIEADEET